MTCRHAMHATHSHRAGRAQPRDASEQPASSGGAFVSYPVPGKHLAFDGRLLHGAIEELALPPPPPCTAGGAGEGGGSGPAAPCSYTRVTLMVNVWVDHRPARCAHMHHATAGPHTRPHGARASLRRRAHRMLRSRGWPFASLPTAVKSTPRVIPRKLGVSDPPPTSGPLLIAHAHTRRPLTARPLANRPPAQPTRPPARQATDRLFPAACRAIRLPAKLAATLSDIDVTAFATATLTPVETWTAPATETETPPTAVPPPTTEEGSDPNPNPSPIPDPDPNLPPTTEETTEEGQSGLTEEEGCGWRQLEVGFIPSRALCRRYPEWRQAAALSALHKLFFHPRLSVRHLPWGSPPITAAAAAAAAAAASASAAAFAAADAAALTAAVATTSLSVAAAAAVTAAAAAVTAAAAVVVAAETAAVTAAVATMVVTADAAALTPAPPTPPPQPMRRRNRSPAAAAAGTAASRTVDVDLSAEAVRATGGGRNGQAHAADVWGPMLAEMLPTANDETSTPLSAHARDFVPGSASKLKADAPAFTLGEVVATPLALAAAATVQLSAPPSSLVHVPAVELKW